ncbi:hypothetical protein ETI06_07050 [Macrococcoides goetzii]|nr:hypothetical protein [Macrococcus goetzii]TDM49295.1 hypothetical protein ETI06_07050 [Macrococcus goetzii]
MNEEKLIILLETLSKEGTKNLPQYQARVINELLNENSFDRTAEIWAEYNFENTSPFSSENTKATNYVKEIKKELKKFICGDEKYESNRNEIVSKVGITDNAILISSMSSVIGNQIGLAGTFVAPVLVLLIKSLSNISINAWCNLQE